MKHFAESSIEEAAIGWLKSPGDIYAFGLEIAFDRFLCMLTSLHDRLLPKLMRGEVRVKDI